MEKLFHLCRSVQRRGFVIILRHIQHSADKNNHIHSQAFYQSDKYCHRNCLVPGAVVQISVATVLGVLVGWMFGWSAISGLVFGMAISVASTVVLTRVLEDNQNLHTPGGHVALGWLVVEDLFTILLLVLIPAVMEARQSGAGEIGRAHV